MASESLDGQRELRSPASLDRHRLAKALGAAAFTQGNDITFAPGHYDRARPLRVGLAPPLQVVASSWPTVTLRAELPSASASAPT